MKLQVNEFRANVSDELHKELRKETTRAARFVRQANYYEAKITEAKIEGLHVALGILIDEPAVVIEEVKDD